MKLHYYVITLSGEFLASFLQRDQATGYIRLKGWSEYCFIQETVVNSQGQSK